MSKYIGFKMVEAEPMTHGQYSLEKYGEETNTKFSIENKNSEGYKITYADGYVSWSPKKVFEKSYMQVSDNNTITQENVDGFFKKYEDFKLGEKTTVVKATLNNDFVIVESSSCVDPANFDQNIGIEICLEKIKDKVWNLLGFLLQTAKTGIK